MSMGATWVNSLCVCSTWGVAYMCMCGCGVHVGMCGVNSLCVCVCVCVCGPIRLCVWGRGGWLD